MNISGLDFLSDFEKRLRLSAGDALQSDQLEFHRLLNFFDKTMVLKIGWPELPLGRLTCRMVEEPQDFYFRGLFQTAPEGQPYAFTLRPGKDYEKDIGLLVDAITVTAKDVKGYIEPVNFADAFAQAFSETPPTTEPQESNFNPEAFFASLGSTPASPEEPSAPYVPSSPDEQPAKDTRTPEEILGIETTAIPQKPSAPDEPPAKDTRTPEEILGIETTPIPQKPSAPDEPPAPPAAAEPPAAPAPKAKGKKAAKKE